MGSRPYQRLIGQNGKCPLLREFVTAGILFEIPNSRYYDCFYRTGIMPYPCGEGICSPRRNDHRYLYTHFRGR